ncbi:MAG: RNA polymerase sigma factor [Maribacter sp.]
MGDLQKKKQREIVLGFKKNDSKVMEALYTTVFPKVCLFILKNNGNETKAKDIFQEAFIACWKNIKADKFSEEGNVEAYLYTIAKNKWTDFLRSTNYKKVVAHENKLELIKVVDDEKIDESVEKAQRNAMQKALNQLGSNCKTLLNLFYFERKSMDDISQTMNLTSASARNQKYRCMEKLRKLSLEVKNNG